MFHFKEEKIVVTSALPYANGEIHLGHVVSTYLPADIFTRFLKLNGNKAFHICGTDDFGVPVLIKAEKEGKKPAELVKEFWEKDKKDLKSAGIDFDVFSQTSSEENIELVQYFFQELNKKGFIFTQQVEQYYCQNDKKFLPDRYVIGNCPFCGKENQYGDVCENCGRTYAATDLKDPKCAIDGSVPIRKKSLHYFFKLSKFDKKLKDWMENNKNLQPEVTNYLLQWIKEGLRDWDITRDISWGVKIPLKEADGKVLYGWFDNHLGYISFTLKLLKDKKIDGKKFWNDAKIYHFIGKDIVYHHYLFLPAMRMGEGSFKLPDVLPVRGHLLLQGHKFSKSRGVYIGLREFLESFPADYLRYYLASITPYDQSEINFNWDEFQAKINNELVATLGNFIHRAISFINSTFEGEVPKPKEYDDLDNEFIKKIGGIGKEVGDEIEKNEIQRGLKKILEFGAFCNQYFQKKEPWKTKDPTSLYLSIKAVRALAILLYPYVPFASEKLWKQLNFKGEVSDQKWDSISEIKIRPKHKIQKAEILFRKVEDEEIKIQKDKLPK
ncbi:MAG: methionine--tRNA ligase [Candidatus Aenigmarchaeota archaeon]|nr:methionine--tRNA ligase [Candidatus Aenigmarchaeota archaeon]